MVTVGADTVCASVLSLSCATDQVKELLEYYMGKNTQSRQEFIIGNLRIEEDRPDDDTEEETEDE